MDQSVEEKVQQLLLHLETKADHKSKLDKLPPGTTKHTLVECLRIHRNGDGPWQVYCTACSSKMNPPNDKFNYNMGTHVMSDGHLARVALARVAARVPDVIARNVSSDSSGSDIIDSLMSDVSSPGTDDDSMDLDVGFNWETEVLEQYCEQCEEMQSDGFECPDEQIIKEFDILDTLHRHLQSRVEVQSGDLLTPAIEDEIYDQIPLAAQRKKRGCRRGASSGFETSKDVLKSDFYGAPELQSASLSGTVMEAAAEVLDSSAEEAELSDEDERSELESQLKKKGSERKAKKQNSSFALFSFSESVSRNQEATPYESERSELESESKTKGTIFKAKKKQDSSLGLFSFSRVASRKQSRSSDEIGSLHPAPPPPAAPVPGIIAAMAAPASGIIAAMAAPAPGVIAAMRPPPRQPAKSGGGAASGASSEQYGRTSKAVQVEGGGTMPSLQKLSLGDNARPKNNQAQFTKKLSGPQLQRLAKLVERLRDVYQQKVKRLGDVYQQKRMEGGF